MNSFADPPEHPGVLQIARAVCRPGRPEDRLFHLREQPRGGLFPVVQGGSRRHAPAAGELDKPIPLDKYRSLLHLLMMTAVPGAGCFPEAALEGKPLISLNMRPWKEPTPPTWLRTASSWPILQPKGSAPKRGTLEVRARASSTYSGKRRPASEPAGSPGTFRVRAPLKQAPETEDFPEAALEGPPRMAGLAQRRNALWRTIRFEGTAGPEPR